jgi:hypothetical protein
MVPAVWKLAGTPATRPANQRKHASSKKVLLVSYVFVALTDQRHSLAKHASLQQSTTPSNHSQMLKQIKSPRPRLYILTPIIQA